MANDGRALSFPVGSKDSSLTWPVENGMSLLPPNINLATDIANANFTAHPATGTISGNFAPNVHQTMCPWCNGRFYDRAAMEKHKEDNTTSCRICGNAAVWCARGLGSSESGTCQEFCCAEHAICFPTRKEAVDHASHRSHSKCFFFDCKDTLARGDGNCGQVSQHVWEQQVAQHVWEKHWQYAGV